MSAEEPEEPEGPEEASETLENLIENRIHSLQNRRFFLQQLQQRIRRAEGREGDPLTGHTTGEDKDVSELALVERELEDLLNQKQNLLNDHNATKGVHVGLGPMSKMETPEGGIYTLPPLLMLPNALPEVTAPPSIPLEETKTAEPPQPEKIQEPHDEEEEDTKQIEPVDSLNKMGAFTRCLSCKRVVFTETKKFNGDSAWLACCVCSLLGGIVGFCFIPFCLDRMKSVRHSCPECQATIHTFHPF